jgi:hypothetical protein
MWSDVISLTTPGPDITFNSGSDVYWLDPTKCSWSPDLRVTADPAPRSSGAIIFPILKGAGHLTLAGVLAPANNSPTTRDTMADSLMGACDAILAADGTIAHATRGNLTVRCEVYPGFGGAYLKDFVLVLIAADPGSW